MASSALFTEFKLGSLTLKNRLVMAPMTRNRAVEKNTPNDLMALYYAQRASAGLIITEGSQITPEGLGYPNTPGIHSEEQVAGWKKVTDSVHKAEGRIFLQLWHVGRISHSLLLPEGTFPVAPSAVPAKGQVYTPQGMKPFETPRALSVDEIPGIIELYKKAAENARRAGFDGVEIHGANGYLIDQFLQDGTNHRTDRYGSSIQNRIRFLQEVTDAVVAVWGGERVGVRLSPNGSFNDMADSHPEETFGAAIRALDGYGLAYLHMREGTAADEKHGRKPVPIEKLRSLFHGTVILNDGYTRLRAEEALNQKKGDLFSLGVPFLANPDLPKRWETSAPLNPPHLKTFYSAGEKGYTDYPFLNN